ncbi:uncharacterized protein [Dermacentor albipictus]|uniref:uncharacterized protein isoform X15 n=1 Tax=Dermacentor albipictus TaxID=60249 RepID=UPI0038FD3B0D
MPFLGQAPPTPLSPMLDPAEPGDHSEFNLPDLTSTTFYQVDPDEGGHYYKSDLPPSTPTPLEQVDPAEGGHHYKSDLPASTPTPLGQVDPAEASDPFEFDLSDWIPAESKQVDPAGGSHHCKSDLPASTPTPLEQVDPAEASDPFEFDLSDWIPAESSQVDPAEGSHYCKGDLPASTPTPLEQVDPAEGGLYYESDLPALTPTPLTQVDPAEGGHHYKSDLPASTPTPLGQVDPAEASDPFEFDLSDWIPAESKQVDPAGGSHHCKSDLPASTPTPLEQVDPAEASDPFEFDLSDWIPAESSQVDPAEGSHYCKGDLPASTPTPLEQVDPAEASDPFEFDLSNWIPAESRQVDPAEGSHHCKSDLPSSTPTPLEQVDPAESGHHCIRDLPASTSTRLGQVDPAEGGHHYKSDLPASTPTPLGQVDPAEASDPLEFNLSDWIPAESSQVDPAGGSHHCKSDLPASTPTPLEQVDPAEASDPFEFDLSDWIPAESSQVDPAGGSHHCKSDLPASTPTPLEQVDPAEASDPFEFDLSDWIPAESSQVDPAEGGHHCVRDLPASTSTPLGQVDPAEASDPFEFDLSDWIPAESSQVDPAEASDPFEFDLSDWIPAESRQVDPAEGSHHCKSDLPASTPTPLEQVDPAEGGHHCVRDLPASTSTPLGQVDPAEGGHHCLRDLPASTPTPLGQVDPAEGGHDSEFDRSASTPTPIGQGDPAESSPTNEHAWPPWTPASASQGAAAGQDADACCDRLDTWNPWKTPVVQAETPRRGRRALATSTQTDNRKQINRTNAKITMKRKRSPIPNRKNGQDHHMHSVPCLEWGAQEPPSINECLRVNRLYQNELMSAIETLKEHLATNRENQKMVNELVANARKRPGQLPPRKRSWVVFGHPYFKDINGMRAPMNDDEVSRRRLCLQDPYLYGPKPWFDKEIALLQISIQKNLIKTITDSCMQRREYLMQFKKNRCETAKEVEELDAKVASLEEMGLDQLREMTDRSIDWCAISANEIGIHHSPQQCELMWKNKLSRDVSAWTPKEDIALKALVKKLGIHEWDKVAAQLGGRRTPFQCAERYMQHFNKCIKSGAFTKNEDMQLLKLIDEHRVDGEIRWDKVTSSMPTRTRMQLSYRWERVLNPNLRRGKFSEDEDKMLVIAVETYGHQWVTIKDYLPGRTSHQCRERYANTFSGNIVFGHWSPQEDLELIKMIQKHGTGKWSRIASEMTSRSDHMIKTRYHRLCKLFSTKDLEKLKSLAKSREWKETGDRTTSKQRRLAIIKEVEQEQAQDGDPRMTMEQKCDWLYTHLLSQNYAIAISDDESPETTNNSKVRRKRAKASRKMCQQEDIVVQKDFMAAPVMECSPGSSSPEQENNETTISNGWSSPFLNKEDSNATAESDSQSSFGEYEDYEQCDTDEQSSKDEVGTYIGNEQDNEKLDEDQDRECDDSDEEQEEQEQDVDENTEEEEGGNEEKAEKNGEEEIDERPMLESIRMLLPVFNQEINATAESDSQSSFGEYEDCEQCDTDEQRSKGEVGTYIDNEQNNEKLDEDQDIESDDSDEEQEEQEQDVEDENMEEEEGGNEEKAGKNGEEEIDINVPERPVLESIRTLLPVFNQEINVNDRWECPFFRTEEENNEAPMNYCWSSAALRDEEGSNVATPSEGEHHRLFSFLHEKKEAEERNEKAPLREEWPGTFFIDELQPNNVVTAVTDFDPHLMFPD